MKCFVEIGSVGMIYVPGFMKNGAGVETILRTSFRNLKGCNIDITDGNDLYCIPLE
jgi:hypothetical protein